MARRIFTACLGTETNSFSPIPTGLGLFGATMLVRGGAHGEHGSLFGIPLVRWRERARALGWQVVEGLAAFALPAGTTTRSAFEALRDEILADLEAALPVDAVLLNLHGAMIADGYPDAEGDLLARVRAIVGPRVPVLAELDLHGHLTALKVDSADALVFYKEYPHVDAAERADEVFALCRRMLDEGLVPTMAFADCRMLGIYPTTLEPMRGFVARMKALEGRDGVLSVSLAHGFPWGDTPEVGTRVLVVTDGDAALAVRLADELADWVWRHRDRLMAPFVDLDAAIDRVLGSAPQALPFVLADTADNTGIGAPGDATFVLRRLIERQAGGFAIAPLWDPVAVGLAFDAGIGARLPMRIGGKLGPSSGDPVDADVTVMGLGRDVRLPFGGSLAPLGDTAWIRIALGSPGATSASGETPVAPEAAAAAHCVDVVLATQRVQGFDPACFAGAGLDPLAPRALVVKSTQHFQAGFAPIAREIVYLATPGAASMDFARLPHATVTAPLWPREADPHRQPVEACLFDLGNVLIEVDFERSFAHWGAAAGVAPEVLRARYRTGHDYERHERGELDEAGYFDTLRRDLGIALDDDAMRAGWNALLCGEVIGIRGLVDALDPAMPRYVFSNSNAAHQARWAADHRELLARFATVFVSSDIGHRKPQAQAFLHVAGRIGVAPSRILFFDDNADNVAGARAVGMQAVRVRSVADVAAALRERGLIRTAPAGSVA